MNFCGRLNMCVCCSMHMCAASVCFLTGSVTCAWDKQTEGGQGGDWGTLVKQWSVLTWICASNICSLKPSKWRFLKDGECGNRQEACTCYDKHTFIHAASHSIHTGARVHTSHVLQMWANWLQSSGSRAGFVCSVPACSLREGQGATLHSWNVFRLCLAQKPVRFI